MRLAATDIPHHNFHKGEVKMKKKYTAPEIDITVLGSEEILTYSNGPQETEEEDNF